MRPGGQGASGGSVMISTPPAFKAAIMASTSLSARSADGYEITFATNHLATTCCSAC
ncbi:hypothetical protein [Mesorhizobium sp.]|uniref:hypothetical protein n=1 Tax=Mesorhizobium sp. TaxID=1871066 RepID=UPI0025F6AD10|nr:hypothetical protein [Mesorhizobium sp.]